MSLKLDRKVVVKFWTLRAVVDSYIGFDIWDRFNWYSAFFWHQGLEKICKAYLLGTKSSQYENLPEQQAREEIDYIARNKNEMGHNLIEMLDKLISMDVLSKEIKTKVCTHCRSINNIGKDFTGEEYIEILQKAYIECRYPLVPKPVEKVYLSPNKAEWWDPVSSDDLMKFAFEVGLKILKKIEKDFNIPIRRDKFLTFVEDRDWTRFCRIFFKDIYECITISINSKLKLKRNLMP